MIFRSLREVIDNNGLRLGTQEVVEFGGFGKVPRQPFKGVRSGM